MEWAAYLMEVKLFDLSRKIGNSCHSFTQSFSSAKYLFIISDQMEGRKGEMGMGRGKIHFRLLAPNQVGDVNSESTDL